MKLRWGNDLRFRQYIIDAIIRISRKKTAKYGLYPLTIFSAPREMARPIVVLN
ncbi:hypothetical protein HY494_01320 [Candidatus Woesearchaeota archaeon]|nr:hypothetical protein [Candidatus Woesearchaeota archaeon]